ncbi:MAG: DUF2996 domain-containing protein [Leptolyngbya sp. SIO4C1]|nr:DUF2996 domain-containing protein [Leptolyngbya sp. SIO4C1]
MAEDSTPKASEDKAADKSAKKPAAKAGDKPAGKAGAKPKKEKPPKPEEKPFQDFMQQHYLPEAETALKEEGLKDLTLQFEKQPLEITGGQVADDCWQVIGRWDQGKRQFNIAFLDEDIKGQKVFTYATSDAKPSTVEQFMGDERRITLDLMVLYTVQRLNAQKWLTRN